MTPLLFPSLEECFAFPFPVSKRDLAVIHGTSALGSDAGPAAEEATCGPNISVESGDEFSDRDEQPSFGECDYYNQNNELI